MLKGWSNMLSMVFHAFLRQIPNYCFCAISSREFLSVLFFTLFQTMSPRKIKNQEDHQDHQDHQQETLVSGKCAQCRRHGGWWQPPGSSPPSLLSPGTGSRSSKTQGIHLYYPSILSIQSVQSVIPLCFL